ncbi:PIG-L deacetylase family protein [Deinococcus maricopensis]|uniref:LmbE family protein n=1 Tax=Deinococcus maricopensis (strain DSM 21211 / LMG 22137 / NRRL B-23946 / LB-34) TaxID=709986 RepID=E8U5Q7_DEIML|nr:PIG-L deacetylase family protein [Deinococcus maricopensis]ADV66396.1 LmbE family protein [Deinococcus maricopensis DSM 21211]
MDSALVKLLIIVPHPDDEVYGAAGTIMDFLGDGERVALVTLTRGEAGRTLGLADTAEDLARLRGAELRACLDTLGVTEHVQLTYPDKVLNTTPHEELVAVAQQYIREYRPEILLTFPPNGSNGHPDHVETSLAVRDAIKALPDAERPARVWFYAGPQPEAPHLRDAYLPPTVERDVTHHLTRKLTAIACHRSQALSTVDFIRKFAARITTETFHEVPGHAVP